MPTDKEDLVEILEQTAQNLKKQSELLRGQSRDLAKEAARIRAASRKARERRRKSKA